MKKIIIFLSFFAVLIAQDNHNHPEWVRCAADELEQELQLTNPEFIAERDIYVEKAQRLLRENPQWRTNEASMNTIYIPVVFHIVYNQDSQNLPDSVIESQIDVLNEDYRRLNENSVDTREEFLEFAGDPNIEFYLISIIHVRHSPPRGISFYIALLFWNNQFRSTFLKFYCINIS